MSRTGLQGRRGSSAEGSWSLLSRGPSPAVVGIVERLTGYEEWSPRPLRRREVAHPSITLIFNLGPPLIVGGPGAAPRARDSFIAGRLDLYGVTEFSGLSRGLQLDMTPVGAHLFLGIPMHELCEVVLPVEDVLGGFGRDLVDRLAGTPGWTRRFDLLEAAVARRVAAARPAAPDALRAWARLRATDGLLPIGALAAELGCSRRHLGARFREQVGVTPKTAARVLRFRRCVKLLERNEGSRFAEIATGCGYYDQAHMNREFRELSGTTPGSFVASRLPEGRGIAADPQLDRAGAAGLDDPRPEPAQVTSVQDAAARVA